MFHRETGRIPLNKTILRGETDMKLFEVNKQIEELRGYYMRNFE